MKLVGVAAFYLAAASASASAVAQSKLFEDYGATPGARFGISMVCVGDLNGDGVPDRVIGEMGVFSQLGGPLNLGRVVALSGLNGAVLWSTFGPNVGDYFGASVADAGDVDNDGVNDIGVAAKGFLNIPGSVHVLSGASGSVLRAYTTYADRADVVAGGGDFDGDGKADLLACNVDGIRVYSGGSGLVVFSLSHTSFLPPSPSAPTYLWAGRSFTACFLKDLHNDGFDEIVVGVRFGPSTVQISNGWVVLLAGPSGAALSGLGTTIPFPSTSPSQLLIGHSVMDAGDVDGDGLHDVALGYLQQGSGPPHFIEVRSGATGLPIWTCSSATTPGGSGFYMASIGDIDGDGRPEVATSGYWTPPGSPTPPPIVGWSILNGSTGAPMWSELGATIGDFGIVAAAGDVNLDGTPDVMFGNPVYSATVAGVQVFGIGQVRTHSGVLLAGATVASLGGGCGGSAPVLSLSPPVFGGAVAFSVAGAASGASALLLVDLAPSSPTSIGPGCTLHPDSTHAASWIVVPLGIDPSGAAATSLSVPFFPLLAGLPVTAQVIVIDPAAALGFTLTNGVAATLGY